MQGRIVGLVQCVTSKAQLRAGDQGAGELVSQTEESSVVPLRSAHIILGER